MSDLPGSTYTSSEPPGHEQPQQPVHTGSGSGPRAGFWRRFGAYFLDGLILAVPQVALAVVVSQAAANIIGLIIGIAYFAFFEGGATGQTIGKKALGIRVIDFRAGGPIGYGRAVIRYFARFLSTLPLLLGYFWMLWDKENQTWHDKLATTVVVPVEAYPVR